jgi:hypothetical protein
LSEIESVILIAIPFLFGHFEGEETIKPMKKYLILVFLLAFSLSNFAKDGWTTDLSKIHPCEQKPIGFSLASTYLVKIRPTRPSEKNFSLLLLN